MADTAAEWIRFWITAFFLAGGLLFFIGAVIGNCRFAYVMNRVHAAGLGDTMGLVCVTLGLICGAGSFFEAGKLLLPPFFLWLCSPVSSHFLAQIEYFTNKNIYDHMEWL